MCKVENLVVAAVSAGEGAALAPVADALFTAAQVAETARSCDSAALEPTDLRALDGS
jgi:hypothetical protein